MTVYAAFPILRAILRGGGVNVGDFYLKDSIIDTFVNMRYNKNIQGDKFEVFKTKILKQFPFPEVEGENFLSEAIVWSKMSGEYKFIFKNQILYLCEYQQDGLTANSRKTINNNPIGASLVYKQLSSKGFKMKLRIKYTIMYIAYSKFAKHKFKNVVANASSKFLAVLLYPLGIIAYYKFKKI